MCDFANEGETPESGVDYCLAQIARPSRLDACRHRRIALVAGGGGVLLSRFAA
jgi:hypothetical protein